MESEFISIETIFFCPNFSQINDKIPANQKIGIGKGLSQIKEDHKDHKPKDQIF